MAKKRVATKKAATATKKSRDWKSLRFAGQNVCVAGKGKQYSISADEARSWCEDDGARLVSDVTDDTDVLILMEIGVAAAKKKAEKLNQKAAAISIVDLPTFRQMFVPSMDEVSRLLSAGKPGRERLDNLLKRCRAIRAPIDMTGINLKGADISDLDLNGLILRAADFRQATVKSAYVGDLSDASLDKTSGAYFRLENMSNCQIRQADLPHLFIGARSHNTKIADCDFSKSNLDDSHFSYSTIQDSTFAKSIMSNVSFNSVNVNNVDFSGVDFSDAEFKESTIRGASRFVGAKFRNADVRDTDFGDADLSKTDFTGARLTGVKLDHANLNGANFKDAILLNTSFGNADTSKAKNLSFWPVSNANLGPACKRLADVAKKADSLEVSADVMVSEPKSGAKIAGPVTIRARSKTDYGTEPNAFYEIHNLVVREASEHLDRTNFTDRILVKTFSDALRILAQLWGHGELDLDSIKCSGSKSPLKGKALKTAATEALAEVFGASLPSASQTKAKAQQTRSAAKALKDELLAELRGGRRGVDAFNQRDADELHRRKQFRFRKEDFSNAQLIGLQARKVDFQNCQFDDANLSRADLTRGDLRGTDMTGANCKQANLESADLRNSKLVGTNLSKANLEFSRLDDADLRGANLTNAKLWGSYLRGANLAGAKSKGADWRSSVFDADTIFPDGFVIPEDFDFAGPGRDPRLESEQPPDVEAVDNFDQFMDRVAASVDSSRLVKALKMLKADSFQLFSDVDDQACTGIVRSQSDSELVYSCRLTSDGGFACCTQNLNACGGLRGALCKHLLVLLIGLTKAEKIDAKTAAAWIQSSQKQKPNLDKDQMAEVLLKYKGVEAGEVDWRPTETVPEDYFSM